MAEGGHSLWQRYWWRYLLAVVLTGGTLALRVALNGWAGDRPLLILFVVPILLSAYFGGLGAGLVATVVAALGTNYFLVQPLGSLAFDRPVDLAQWLVLVLCGAVASVMGGAFGRGGERPPPDSLVGASHRTERRVRLAFVIAILVLVLTGGLAQMSVIRMARDGREAVATISLIGQLDRILALTIDAETAQRGYVITGDVSYLAPYDEVLSRVDREVAALHEIVVRHPDQRVQVDELVGLVRLRLAEVSRTIELRRSLGLGSSIDQIAAGTGKDLQDQIRRKIDQLGATERSLFLKKATDAERSGRTTMVVIVAANAIALLLATTGIYLIGRDFAGARRAEQALRVAHEKLEQRVAERTAELAQANRQLQESEQRFRQLAESLPQLVWSCEAEGPCDYLSPQWVAFTGIPAEQQLGYRWLEQVHPDDRERTIHEWQSTAARGLVFEGEFRVRRHDGVYRWFDSRGVPLRDLEGRVVRWFGANTDVTERRLGERRLVAQLAVSRTLAGALSLKEAAGAILAALGESEEWEAGAIWEIDAAGTALRCTEYWCRSGTAFPAVEAATRRGEFPRGVGLPGRVWATGRAQLIPDVTTDDGYLRAAEASAAGLRSALGFPILVDNEVAGVVDFLGREKSAADARRRDTFEAIGRQIGVFLQRRRAEGALRELNASLERRVAERTAQWEAANRELEAFSYSVSHDLRAPLRTVDGFAQALVEDFGSQLPAEGQEMVRTIRDGARKMAELIDDLLTFSRLSRAPLNREPIDMRQLVLDVLRDLEGARAGRDLRLDVGALPTCEGDLPLVRQVWLNLLANAVKYTGRREHAVVEVGAEPDAQAGVAFFVRDNGAGFDMKYAHKLFGVFQRLHRAEDYEGTGVGLAIVQRIVTRHGGRIWAEGAPDRGATFHFTLSGGNQP